MYWDMQVIGTNNYVDEYGFIHHNSGKSEGGIVRACKLLLQHPGENIGYYLPTYDLIKLRVMPGIESFLGRIGIPATINKSDYSVEAKGFGKIILRSYDNPGRIISYEVAHSIVDELDTLDAEKAAYVWRKVDERNRQRTLHPTGNTIGNVTTPDQGYNGFTYTRWVKDPLPNSELIKAPTYSNPYLPPGYVEQIRNNYDPILADMYIEGDFVSLSRNKVYHFFDRNKHHTNRVLTADDPAVHIGLDFNIGGCCATVWVIEDNKPIAVDEFVSHDTYDVVNNINQRYKGKRAIIYPDASGKAGRTNASQSDIEILQSNGLIVDAPNANPGVRDRINSVNALFSHDRIRVNTDKCPELTFALESQGYTKKGEPEKFDTHPAIDDWVDCSGYFLNRRWPIQRPSTVGRFTGN
jgi:hypothetical protein